MSDLIRCAGISSRNEQSKSKVQLLTGCKGIPDESRLRSALATNPHLTYLMYPSPPNLRHGFVQIDAYLIGSTSLDTHHAAYTFR